MMPDSPVRAVLWDPAEHEALRVDPEGWDPRRAEAGIEMIIERTRAAFTPGEFWPRHPADDYGSEQPADLSLWIGAAGVLWALEYLGAGLGEADVYEAYLERPDLPGNSGLMQGESGVLLLSWRLARTQAKLELLLMVIEEGLATSFSDELFDGIPGLLVAALHIYRLEGSHRAAAIWRDGAAALLKRFAHDPELGYPIWVQHRRGRLIRSLGAGHGFASNAACLLAGRELLDAREAAIFEGHATQALVDQVLEADGLVNWPTAADPYWAEIFPTRVQWCHGAPGILTGLQKGTSVRLVTPFRRAGELIWRAGPLAKGAGICHGTAGNALALLALHERTGEALWLDRARALALHALTQVEAGDPRHSLWTGDIGVALVLHACLDGDAGVPIIDFL